MKRIIAAAFLLAATLSVVGCGCDPNDPKGCGFKPTQPTTPGCTYTVSDPSRSNFDQNGGQGTISLTTQPGCSWSASTSVSWITIAPTSSSGSGTVTFTVAQNTGTSTRTGTVSVYNRTFTITQTGTNPPQCNYSVSPTSVSVPALGGTQSVTVTTQASCNWSAVSNSPGMITITSGSSGSGSGSVTFNVATNTGPARSGSITVTGLAFSQTVTVNQAGVTTFQEPTISWKMCSGSPSDPNQCSQVGGTSASSYTISRSSNNDWKFYGLVNHFRQAGCSGTLKLLASFPLDGGSDGQLQGTLNEATDPSPRWLGGGFHFNAPNMPSPPSTQSISFSLSWSCTGGPSRQFSSGPVTIYFTQ